MPVAATLSIDQAGITYQWFTASGKTRHEAMVAWEQISEITVFKRDLYTYDLICLKISRSDGLEIELDEEDGNWEELVKVLPTYLPGTTEWADWFTDVAFPAFESRDLTIFTRKTTANNP